MPQPEEHQPDRLRHHPALLALTLTSSVVCLWLGVWQWHRFNDSGGTAQNLGYALQWPLFAVFAVYGYLRFFGLLKDSREGRDASPRQQFCAAMPPRPPAALLDELDTSRNRGLAEYNTMLAGLAEQAATAQRTAPTERQRPLRGMADR